MLWAGGEAGPTFGCLGTVPAGQLCIPCEVFSLLAQRFWPSSPSPSPTAGPGRGLQGSLGGLWAAGAAPCRLSSLEGLQGPQTVAPFLSCVTASIVFLGTTSP